MSGIFTLNDTFTTPDSPGVTTVQNSIILQDGTTPACGTALGGSIVSAWHNLVGDSSCGFGATGDQQNTDPLLGPLADNGGPTLTHALLAGSPAIDAGGTTLPGDQRGVPRPQGTVDDIGAFEAELSPPGNQPPVANDDSYATPQDTALTVASPGVLGNDSDPEGHGLRISTFTQPTNGTVAPTFFGGFTYTPDPGFSGTDSFTYRASDNALDSNLATVTITVNAVNQPPVANDDSYATPQDTALTVASPGVLGNDVDPEGHALRISTFTQPTNGTVAPTFFGGFTYTPDPSFSGTDSFTYRASDNALDSNLATVTITVNAVNQPPVANNDSYATPQDTPLTVASPGVLGNDVDPEGHALRISTFTQPTNGTVAPTFFGGFTYTPDAKLLRHRLVYLPGLGQCAGLESGHGDHHRERGQPAAGGQQRQLRHAAGHAADGGLARRAGQRQRSGRPFAVSLGDRQPAHQRHPVT